MNKKNCLKFGMAFLLFAPGMLLASCGDKHEYSSEWTHDETSHWHICVTEGHDDTSDNANHEFGEWAEQTPAGVHVDRVEFRACGVCGYKEERTVENTGYHTYSDKWSFDSAQHWHPCAVEGCDAKKDAVNHTLTVVDEVPATCMADGMASYKKCDCGALFDLNGQLVADISGFKLNKDATKHTFSAWIEQVDANCANETNGTKGHYDCLECGKHFDANKNEVTDDDLKIAWTHNLSKKLFDSDYHIDYCTVCNKTFDDTKAAHAKTLNHDDTHHWYSCAVCDSDVIGKTEHTYADPTVYLEATYTDDGVMLETCTVCNNKKYTDIPMLAAKDRTIAYNGATSKTYNNGYLDLKSSDIVVTTTSTESAIEDIKTGLQYGFYTDSECKTAVGGNGKIIDAGTYYIKITLAATDEWQYAEKVVEYKVYPRHVMSYGENAIHKCSIEDIPADGMYTLGVDTGIKGQTAKAILQLDNYTGAGEYTFKYGDIKIVDENGSEATDYLKNYDVWYPSSEEDTDQALTVYEFADSFALSQILSNTSDTSTGKQISTVEARLKLADKALRFTIGDKIVMDNSVYMTVTCVISSYVYENTGSTVTVYPGKYLYGAPRIYFTCVGEYSDDYLLSGDRTYTFHGDHDYGVTGTCACGDSVARTFEERDNGVEATLSVADNKAFFNFEYCGESGRHLILNTPSAKVTSVDCYRDGVKKYSLEKQSGYVSTTVDVWALPSGTILDDNETYHFVIVLADSAASDEISITLKAPFHVYDDEGSCTCGWTKQ